VLYHAGIDDGCHWYLRTPARNCVVWCKKLRERGGGNREERLGFEGSAVAGSLGVREEVGEGAGWFHFQRRRGGGCRRRCRQVGPGGQREKKGAAG
jgi:hypothetical protein